MISVIVPVYNTEKYLDKCIQSILAQTYTDFELLLIDDGSTDSSGAICDKYAEQDSRVRVFHKENGGVSSARNLGLDNVNGEWIAFVDSDDWVEENWLGALMEIIDKDNDIDIVRFGYIRNDDDYEQKIVSSQDFILVNKEDYLIQNDNAHYYAMLWNTLFKYTLIGSRIRFNILINWSEDFIFTYECYLVVKKMYISSLPLYHYRVSSVGLSNVKDSFVIRAAIQQIYKLKSKLVSNKTLLNNKVNKNYHYWMSRSIKELYHNSYSYDCRYKFCYSTILQNNDDLSLVEKIFFAKSTPFCIKDIILKIYYIVHRFIPK